MSHIPKKKLVDAATADGTMSEVSRLISASYLMANLMWSFFDDATAIIEKPRTPARRHEPRDGQA